MFLIDKGVTDYLIWGSQNILVNKGVTVLFWIITVNKGESEVIKGEHII